MSPGTQPPHNNRPLTLSTRLLLVSLAMFVALATFAREAEAQSLWGVKAGNVSSSLNAVTFGNGLFVAVGDNGAIVTSPDGEQWTPRTSGTQDRLLSIAFGNGRFVATRVNPSAPAITSADGIVWEPVTVTGANGSAVTNAGYKTITFGGGRFLAAGSNSYSNADLISSTNGIQFSVVASAPPFTKSEFRSLLYFRGLFYGYVNNWGWRCSSDGASWTAARWGNGSVAATDGVSKVATVGNVTADAQYSVDAAHTFSNAELIQDRYWVGPMLFQAACAGGGRFVTVDSGARIWTSERGEFWLPVGRYATAGQELRAVTFDGANRFVAVGTAPAGGTALILAANADPLPSPPGYSVTSLKSSMDEVRFVTNDGIIGGNLLVGTSARTAVVLRDGVATQYPDPQYPTRAAGANANGTIVVEALIGFVDPFGNASGYPCIYPGGSKVFANPNTFGTSTGVTSGGVIGGSYKTMSPSYSFGIYKYNTATGQTTDLGNFGKTEISVAGINDRGEMAGSASFRAFLLSPEGSMTMIPTLGGSSAQGLALSSAGHVAGLSVMSGNPYDAHAFLYKDGALQDIDTFNSAISVAYGVNGQGQTVGRFRGIDYLPLQQTGDDARAFLFTDGTMFDLNRLLDASGDGWILNYAFGINDQGWIVGKGSRHGKIEPFLAKPTGGKPAGIQTRLANVSTRLRAGSNDDVLIGGFIIRGGPRNVMLRALGPGVDPQGLMPGRLPDPTLELFDGSGHRIALNDNQWDLPAFPDKNSIGLLGLSVGNPYDSGLLITLPEGNYTAVVRGKNGATGTCMVEVYNADTNFTPGLVNISTRGPVGGGNDVMIAGFIIAGDREQRVLVRALGPTLAAAGVPNPLADPTLEIHDANGTVAQNGNWRSNQEAEILGAGLPPSDDREAAVMLSLWPGQYTAIVRGQNGAIGNGLVEVYRLSD